MDLFCYSQINESAVPFVLKNDILGFDIVMDNAAGVEMLQPFRHAQYNKPCLSQYLLVASSSNLVLFIKW
jgi:hypothetical protein